MKRITKQSPRFDLIRLLDQYVRRRNLNMRDESGHQQFLDDLAEQLRLHKDNEILIHGLRVQAMFAYVVAALDYCKFLKEEDVGDVYAFADEIQAPDFRLVTRDDRVLLVEVKNFHTLDPKATFKLTARYWDSLVRYAELFGEDLYLAIYWSALRIWTLVSLADQGERSGDYTILLVDALRSNQMSLLGDRLIGTTPRLGFRLFSDPGKPRGVDDEGLVNFTIGHAELFCGESVIDDPKEQEIAWMLMNYGDWPVTECPAEVREGEFISASLITAPLERANPHENFEIIGTLSTMIARQYNEITAPSGVVERLSTTRDPTSMEALIPHNYRGSKLPLWRFTVRPSNDE